MVIVQPGSFFPRALYLPPRLVLIWARSLKTPVGRLAFRDLLPPFLRFGRRAVSFFARAITDSAARIGPERFLAEWPIDCRASFCFPLFSAVPSFFGSPDVTFFSGFSFVASNLASSRFGSDPARVGSRLPFFDLCLFRCSEERVTLAKGSQFPRS